MDKYNISGMSCAACSARVEKAVSALDGVDSCAVNLLTNSMTVSGSASETAIISAVKNAGYGATRAGGNQSSVKSDPLADTETPILKKRLLSSLIFLILLMCLSMGHMLGLSLPPILSENPMAAGLLQLILSTIILLINGRFFTSGFKALIHRAPNMDTLVALGSGASFIYSICLLFIMTSSTQNASHYLHGLYFESAAMILVLITVGKMLEARSKGKTTKTLRSLISLSPKTATVIRNGKEVVIPSAEVLTDDIFIVKPGEAIAADAVIIDGHSAVDEAVLTGESIPVDKSVGDKVSAGTINRDGFIKCRAEKVGADTALAQIIKLVEDASGSKAPIAKAADKVSGVFVPIVMSIAVITTVLWLLLSKDIGFSLARGISVLVISCPCALGLATPVAIMVGSGIGAKNGILFKNAEALEQMGRIDIIALDKTGTVTTGSPTVTDIIPSDEVSEKELLSYAAALEAKSEHPLANAITEYASTHGIPILESTSFSAEVGFGLSAIIGGATVCGGNIRYIGSKAPVPEAFTSKTAQLAEEGKTPLYFSRGDKLLGLIAVSDAVKADSREAVSLLKKSGIRVVMLTGDNERTAKAVGKSVGIDEVYAGVLPTEKAQLINSLKKEGKVAMVGDGINDAPALTLADIGIAIGAGTDVAIDAADVILMKNSLCDAFSAAVIGRKTLRNIYMNLFWAFIYNTIGIPIAAGVFIPLGITLNPMLAAAAMSLSSFCVVTNALRLNFINVRSINVRKNKKRKERKAMEITMKVEGMMCSHCEGRVKSCLEELDGVKEAHPSHETATVTVILEKEIPFDVLKNAVEAQGYNVIA